MNITRSLSHLLKAPHCVILYPVEFLAFSDAPHLTTINDLFLGDVFSMKKKHWESTKSFKMSPEKTPWISKIQGVGAQPPTNCSFARFCRQKKMHSFCSFACHEQHSPGAHINCCGIYFMWPASSLLLMVQKSQTTT